jgi:hypothetical protein
MHVVARAMHYSAEVFTSLLKEANAGPATVACISANTYAHGCSKANDAICPPWEKKRIKSSEYITSSVMKGDHWVSVLHCAPQKYACVQFSWHVML